LGGYERGERERSEGYDRVTHCYGGIDWEMEVYGSSKTLSIYYTGPDE
jgi:hypothetical protein